MASRSRGSGLRRRVYSDEERATALAALDGNGGNRQRTARQLGIPRKTLATRASGAVHPVVADLRHQKKTRTAKLTGAVVLPRLGDRLSGHAGIACAAPAAVNATPTGDEVPHTGSGPPGPTPLR